MTVFVNSCNKATKEKVEAQEFDSKIIASIPPGSIEIGEVVNGSAQFTVNTTDLIATYNTNYETATQSGIVFTTVEIVLGDSSYYLMFKNGTHRAALPLNMIGAGGSSGVGILTGSGKTSCTSKDCATSTSECMPRTFFKGCTECSTGDCTRTTTSYNMLQ